MNAELDRKLLLARLGYRSCSPWELLQCSVLDGEKNVGNTLTFSVVAKPPTGSQSPLRYPPPLAWGSSMACGWNATSLWTFMGSKCNAASLWTSMACRGTAASPWSSPQAAEESQFQLRECLLPLLHCPLMSVAPLTYSHLAFLWPQLQLHNLLFFILKSAITEASPPF